MTLQLITSRALTNSLQFCVKSELLHRPGGLCLPLPLPLPPLVQSLSHAHSSEAGNASQAIWAWWWRPLSQNISLSSGDRRHWERLDRLLLRLRLPPAAQGVFVRITRCAELLRIEPWSQPRNVNLYFGETNGPDFLANLSVEQCHALASQFLLV